MPTPKHKRIMVAMSGGVDSTVCAMLLRDAGHEVRCVHFVMSDAHLNGVQTAQAVSDSLGLPFEALDLRERFRAYVIEPFCRQYCEGTTPNPCILCNPNVKFQALIDAADKHGCDNVATGHYARIEYHTPDFAKTHGLRIESQMPHYYLRKAVSSERDQSYMLASLREDQLARLLLPLGERTKQQVRNYAKRAGLSNADAPDSQEICFVPDGNYPAFINRQGHLGKQGRFIAPDGSILKQHRGVEHYTIGQRRGLDVSYGSPVYVQKMLDNGDIQLSGNAGLFANGVTLRGAIQTPYALDAGETVDVKLRSVAKPVACTITNSAPDHKEISFSTPQRAPTPGQAAVFYDGDYVAGCMTITQAQSLI